MRPSRRPSRFLSTLCPRVLACSLTLSALAPALAQSCRPSEGTQSGAQAVTVVELYTSEGCSSCPPADRWLSRVPASPNLIALAFHVDYWDSLGWVDRYGSPAYTQRQAAQQAVTGARFNYTPQIVIDGVDRPDWRQLAGPTANARASAVQLTLQPRGSQVVATVQSNGPGPVRLAAYWAVTENGHRSEVRAGENRGETLKHDHVVREYLPVAAWTAQPGASVALPFQPTAPADATHPREVNLVVVDAITGRPVQAAKLGC